MTSKYRDTYEQIRRLLVAGVAQAQHTPTAIRKDGNTFVYPIVPSPSWGSVIQHIVDGPVITDVHALQRHRACTVCTCQQRDESTQGVRYLAYGIRHDEDSDYGIGLTLSSIRREEDLDTLMPAGKKNTVAYYLP